MLRTSLVDTLGAKGGGSPMVEFDNVVLEATTAGFGVLTWPDSINFFSIALGICTKRPSGFLRVPKNIK